jgi:hypothetical protein
MTPNDQSICPDQDFLLWMWILSKCGNLCHIRVCGWLTAGYLTEGFGSISIHAVQQHIQLAIYIHSHFLTLLVFCQSSIIHLQFLDHCHLHFYAVYSCGLIVVMIPPPWTNSTDLEAHIHSLGIVSKSKSLPNFSNLHSSKQYPWDYGVLKN